MHQYTTGKVPYQKAWWDVSLSTYCRYASAFAALVALRRIVPWNLFSQIPQVRYCTGLLRQTARSILPCAVALALTTGASFTCFIRHFVRKGRTAITNSETERTRMLYDSIARGGGSY